MTKGNLILTPAGSAMWAAVLQPRLRQKGKPDEYLAWTISLDFEQGDADAQAFVQHLASLFHTLHPGSTPGRGSMPFTAPVDPLTQQPLGIWRFSFSRRATWPDGAPQPPPFVQDSAGQPWPTGLPIGNNSLVKIAATHWKKTGGPDRPPGIGLDLVGVRVLNHVPYSAATPLDYSDAFGAPEPGFRLDSATARPSTPPAQQPGVLEQLRAPWSPSPTEVPF